MTSMLLRRGTTFTPLANSHFLSRAYGSSSRDPTIVGNEDEATQFPSPNDDSKLRLSPLFSNNGAQAKDYKIELVDNDTWRVSTSLAEAWRAETKAWKTEVDDEAINYVPTDKEDPDFDEIEDMRIRGNLFYKLDRDSKEFEEYSFDFHRKKSWKNKGNDQTESKRRESSNSNSKNKDEKKESKKEISSYNKNHLISMLHEMDSTVGKKLRAPTFNQLTGPYHEPFCLDIYISKASVRACIVHRATSSVVAVAHSISKDMKFELGSTRNATACAAVGEVLAQRALDDDIHNVVYTPRKGEKLEGKLQIVLESIISNGISVKVKIKQRRSKRSGPPPTGQEHH